MLKGLMSKVQEFKGQNIKRPNDKSSRSQKDQRPRNLKY